MSLFFGGGGQGSFEYRRTRRLRLYGCFNVRLFGKIRAATVTIIIIIIIIIIILK
ncbi:MAG: hypothetical protein ACI8RD_003011 [Bacillariaceae sp.]|jgi:hypothetical protein